MSSEKMVETKKRKLPFGHYKVIINKGRLSNGQLLIEGNEEVVCKPLNQDELAEGWRQHLPKSGLELPIHHWSVTLAQLPAHLWCKLMKDDESKNKSYLIIKDGIYYYSINQTKYDDSLKELFNEISIGYRFDKEKVKNVVDSLENQVNGWLIIRAKKMLKCVYNTYNGDML